MSRLLPTYAALLLLCIALPAIPYQSPTDLTPFDIVSRMIRTQEAQEADLDHYVWVVRRRLDRLRGDGSIDNTKDETYQVSLVDEIVYRRLIARDGRALSDVERRKEDKKLADFIRKHSDDSSEARAERAKKRAHEKQKQREEEEEVPRAFQFTFAGERQTPFGAVYVIRAQPLLSYHPRNSDLKLLQHLSGSLWITKDQFALAHLELNVDRPISFAWGLARLRQGATASYDQQPIPDGHWFPKSASGMLGVRLGFFVHREYRERDEFSDYRRFTATSRIIGISPAR